eukprot:CAMPEP_0170149282 /NCGR_PEP_ID=MMETSP0033_2-20121228/42378_1 /TAXON_ID=195969 /ORGANISM="Dolichomastix tenuilepis, Strain CCMP3274" /LENGTH=196 /DNA_ID=CAMNT_0010386223 /DNA_START=36 /DNA_END=622 /DNA_ORIENTATION=+
MAVWKEYALIAAHTLAGEMLYRGVILTFLITWSADRFVEAGMFPDEATRPAQLTALGVFLLLSLVPKRSAFVPRSEVKLKVRKIEKNKITGKNKLVEVQGDAEEDRRAQAKANQMLVLRLYVKRYEAVRDTLEELLACGAFVLTGNLLAPIAGLIATDSAFSAWQRVVHTRNYDEYKQNRERLLKAAEARLGEIRG